MGYELDMEDYREGNNLTQSASEEMISAAKRGNLDEVKISYRLGGSASYDRSAALRAAAAEGYADIVDFLAHHGADVHALAEEALRKAAAKGSDRTVSLLLDLKADPNAQEGEALLKAAGRGDVNIVRRLLDAGADIHADDDLALRKAAFDGHADVVRLLLQRGADAYALHGAAAALASRDKHAEIVEKLAEVMNRQRDIFTRELAEAPDLHAFLRAEFDGTGESALVRAAKMNCLPRVVERMQQTGDRFTYQDLHGLKDKSGRSLATLAAEQQKLKTLFEVSLWQGNIDDLKSAWDKIPMHVQQKSGVTAEDFSSLAAQQNLKNLKDRAAKFRPRF